MFSNEVPPPYLLNPHVFCCHTGRYSIFLDLRRDLYLSVQQDELSRVIQHSSSGDSHAPDSSSHPMAESDLLVELARQNLITNNLRIGKPIFPGTSPSQLAPSLVHHRRAPTGPRHIVAFIHAMVRTSLDLRYCGLDTIVQRLTSYKSRHPTAPATDIQRVQELVYIFMRLRPFYPKHAVCLYDSLALARFLTTFGVSPSFTVGVIADPFAAHCWLQYATFLLNETPEEASRYTPILCI